MQNVVFLHMKTLFQHKTGNVNKEPNDIDFPKQSTVSMDLVIHFDYIKYLMCEQALSTHHIINSLHPSTGPHSKQHVVIHLK